MNEQSVLTMKDIARELGISVATVSRALRDSPRISEERRRMVQQYARDHNFSPNVLAESLRHSRVQPSHVIGVIVPEFTHYYFSSVLTGIEEAALARGYYIMVALDSHMPLVFYDRICTGIDASRVVVDDYMGAFNAVTYLIETGCRRIAYYGGPMQLEISKNRYNGYRDALLKHKLPVDERLIRVCDNRQDAELITPDLFDGDYYPDAFFAVNDDTAIGILYTVKRMGLRVPEDVSICGFTNGQRAVACDPMLTTVEQRGQRVGEEAAEILIDKVEGHLPMDSVEKRIVRTRLIIRGTTR